MTTKQEQMLELIQKAHYGQYRNAGRAPYWHHCRNVSTLLLSNVERSSELTDEHLIDDMTLAALGHDLLEDTEVTKAQLAKIYPERVVEYIFWLTNEQDDAHTGAYMKKLKNSPEEARLIKYCDLIENTFSVAYGLDDLGNDWAESFFIPIMEQTSAILASTTFAKYPKLAQQLAQLAATAQKLLRSNLINTSVED